jgi:hypothetical protein
MDLNPVGKSVIVMRIGTLTSRKRRGMKTVSTVSRIGPSGLRTGV